MKIQVASDLHLDANPSPLGPEDIAGDVLVLAGDISDDPDRTMLWIRDLVSARGIPAILVPGNHEHVGVPWDKSTLELKSYAEALGGGSVFVLDRETLDLGSVVFVGATLWTDFEGSRDLTMFNVMPEYQGGFWDDGRPLQPKDTRQRHKQTLKWLDSVLDEGDPARTVVITHHAPSPRSITPAFRGAPMNGAFVNTLDAWVESKNPRLWIHGHTHSSHDYRIGQTRVVTNPYGYTTGRPPENKNWEKTCLLTI